MTIAKFAATREEIELPSEGGVYRPGNLATYTYVMNAPLRYIDPLGLNPLDPVERHIMGHASRGNWTEVEHTFKTLADVSDKQVAKLMRDAASKRGNELVKQFKDAGAGQGARSGQHGTPYSRAGAELQREANTVQNESLADALKTAAERLIQKGKSINH